MEGALQQAFSPTPVGHHAAGGVFAHLSKAPTNLTASNHTSSTMLSSDDDLSTVSSCPDLRAESEMSGDSNVELSESPDVASFDPVVGYPSPSVVDEGQNNRPTPTTEMPARRKLQREFEGLTLWLELEEFDNDLTRAVEDFSSKHASPFIPKPHTTAIYGMKHLSSDEARKRLGMVRERIDQWPTFAPSGVQVCSSSPHVTLCLLFILTIPFPLDFMNFSVFGVFHRLERADSRH